MRLYSRIVFGLAASSCLFGFSAFAQEGSIAAPPNFVPATNIYSTKPDVNSAPATYSTKPQEVQEQPWQQPVMQDLSRDANTPFGRVQNVSPSQAQPVYAQPRQVPAGNVPFGRASAEVYAPVPTGPRDVTAAPVDVVGVEAGELAPATPAAAIPLPPKDPTEPTPQTTPIFEAVTANSVPLRHVMLRGLNKVMGHTMLIEGMTGRVLRFGTLEVIVKSCRKSAPTSQEDYAALITARELKPDAQSRDLFSGWMYASSPSLMALEHPVYDVSVVKCSVDKSKAAKKTKTSQKPQA